MYLLEKITKNQFRVGSLWKMIEQFSSKGISLIFSIILARILFPSDYGLIALTVVFTNLSEILIDGGFSTALVRKKNIQDSDYSSVLIISIIISFIIYMVIFSISPTVSLYYGEEKLVLVLRVIGLVVFIQSFSSVRTAYINRTMQYKLLLKCNLAATIISGILGIVFAFLGYGVWALVIQRLLYQLIVTTLLFFSIKLKFRFEVDLKNLKEMFKFGSGVALSSLINYISGSLYSIIIGKKYSIQDLGYFEKGSQLPTQISLYTFGAMSNVLLPTLASHQEDLIKVKSIYKKVVKMTAYLIAPMMVGLALISRELVLIIFTEKWLPIVRIMQYQSLYYFATPFMLINIQVFFALGYSKKRVKTEIIRSFMLIGAIMIFSIWLNCTLNTLALVLAIIAILSSLLTFFEVRTMIDYSIKEGLVDLSKPIFSAIIMGIVIYFTNSIVIQFFGIQSTILVLIIKITIGVLLYLSLSILFKIKEFEEIIDITKFLLSRKD